MKPMCVQMAGVCWMAVTLALFLSTENNVTAVDPDQLAQYVDGIVKMWVDLWIRKILAMFTPQQKVDQVQLRSEFFQSDPGHLPDT